MRPSSRILVAVALFCLGGTSLIRADSPPSPPSPNTPASLSPPLHLTPASLDLGRQAQQKVIEQDVTLRNDGTTPLTLTNVKADCGCTTSELKDNLLAPGASTTLHVRFETRAYTGAIHRRIHISTNAGTSVLPLTVTVAPYQDWDITPLPVMLPPSLSDQPANTDLAVRRLNGGTPRVTEVTTNLPWLEARLQPAATDGLQIVSLRKAPGAPAGTHSVVLTLKTDDPATPALIVPVLVPVASALRVAPNPVLLPRTLPGVETSATFRVIGWREATPPTVQSRRGTITYLGESRGEHTYQLAWTPTAAGTLAWTVQILHGDKTALEISVINHTDEAKPAPPPSAPSK